MLFSAHTAAFQDIACAALNNAIPSDLPTGVTCGECDFGIGGIFSVTAEASVICTVPITDSTSCSAQVMGGGDALGFALGDGNGALSIDLNDCTIAEADTTIDASIDGTFSLDNGIAIGECEIDFEVGDDSVGCTCDTTGCGDFEAKASCTQNGQAVYTSECINVLAIVEEAQEALSSNSQ